MNTRLLKHLGVVAALVCSAAVSSVANAAIVVGSQVQLVGSATIDFVGNISPTNVQILPIGNAGPNVNMQGYLGYNLPNEPFVVTMGNISPGAFPAFVVLQLPAITIAGAETGPTQEATRFLLRNWTITQATVGGFFTALGTGDIQTAAGAFLSNAQLQFSSTTFTPSLTDAQSFAATLTATSVIPVPGAMWIFGSGLLLMTAVMRRKAK